MCRFATGALGRAPDGPTSSRTVPWFTTRTSTPVRVNGHQRPGGEDDARVAG